MSKKTPARGKTGTTNRESASGSRTTKEHAASKKAVPTTQQCEVSVEQEEPPSLAVVGIGASAGGLEAFKQLFSAMPADTGTRKHRIYLRIGAARMNRVELPIEATNAARRGTEASLDLASRPRRHLQSLAQHLMLQRFAPACALINRKSEVLFLSGPVDRYLQLPPGEMAVDLLAMARPGLRTKLRAAIQQAIREDRSVSLGGIRITRDGKRTFVRLAVDPLHQPREADGLLMVAFDEESDDERSRLEHVEHQARTTPDEPEGPNEYESFISQLEDELRITREELQSTIEELDTSNEEFKASNEEVVSINEELQSTNEELETSQEELRSLNEELQTVNSQLEQKVDELESSNNDLGNLLSSTEIATLCLDRQLRIKWFTPAMTRLVKLRGPDAGRPLADFAQQFTDIDLLSDADTVLQRLAPIEKQIESDLGERYLRRIYPYRTEDDRIDGVVITFVDITRQMQDAFDLQASQERFGQFMQHLPGLAWIKDTEGRYVYANAAAVQAFQVSSDRLYGKTDIELFPRETAAQFQANDREAIESPAGIQKIESLQHADGIVHRSLVGKFPIVDADGTPAFVGGMAIDVTELLEAQESLRAAQEQLKLVTDSMSVAVTRCSRDLRFLWMNRHCAEWMGCSPQDLIGRPFVEILGHRACEQLQQYFDQVLAGQQVSFEQEIDYQSPGRRWVRAVYSPTFNESREVDGWVAVIADITDWKLAERALHEHQALRIARLDASLDAIISIDHEGRILEWNPAAEKMFGLMRDDVLEKEMAALIIPPRLREQHRVGLARHLDTGEGVVRGRLLEMPVLRSDGTEFPAEIAIGRVGIDMPPTFTGFVRDITERKRAEEAVRESEERLRLATEGARIGTWQWELETNQATWSEIESELIGCDPALPHTEVQDFFNCVHPDDLAELRRAIDRAIERDEPYDHEFRVLLPNGQVRWLAGKGEVYRNESGRPIRMMGVNLDIHDRKQAEQALAEVNLQLEQLLAERTANTDRLLEEAPDAIVVINRQGEIIRVNQLMESLFGYTRDRLLGQPIEMLLPEAFRAKHPALRDSYFADPRVRAMGLGLDLSARHQDGHDFPVELQLTPLISDGETVAAAAIRDMTERRRFHETQARLAAIMHNTSTAVLVLDKDGTIVNWNIGAERLFGYTAKEIVGQPILQLVPPERACEIEQDQERLAGDRLEVDYNTVRLHKDGTPIDVSITKSQILQPQGAKEFLVITRDIRRQKQLEMQMAELADAERQRLGRELHDTLGQECTAIGMFAATLKKQLGESSKHREVIDRLEHSADRAKRQLRLLTKGLFPVDLDAAGLQVALEDLAEETSSAHELDCHFECRVPIQVRDNFVGTQTYLVIREAVHNAVKHAKAKRIVVCVEESTEGLRFSVLDDGLGMKNAVGEPAGIGLHIMQHRCSLIGAQLRFDSAKDGGTMVRIFLPGRASVDSA